MNVEIGIDSYYLIFAYSFVALMWWLAKRDGFAKDKDEWLACWFLSPITAVYLLPIFVLLALRGFRRLS